MSTYSMLHYTAVMENAQYKSAHPFTRPNHRRHIAADVLISPAALN
jgi:hypothetical protein